jgi:hypothetical protein
MTEYPRLGKWFRAFAFALPILLIWVWIVFHGILKLPVRSILSPALAFCGLSLILAPVMFHARKYAALHQNDRRLIVIAIAAYLLALTLMGIHYAVVFRVLDSKNQRGLSITMLLLYIFVTATAVIASKSLRGSR